MYPPLTLISPLFILPSPSSPRPVSPSRPALLLLCLLLSPSSPPLSPSYPLLPVSFLTWEQSRAGQKWCLGPLPNCLDNTVDGQANYCNILYTKVYSLPDWKKSNVGTVQPEYSTEYKKIICFIFQNSRGSEYSKVGVCYALQKTRFIYFQGCEFALWFFLRIARFCKWKSKIAIHSFLRANRSQSLFKESNVCSF